jgi:uncharacterized protein (DUF849 family)
MMNTPPSLWEAARQETESYHLFAGHDILPKWDIPEMIAINVAVSGRSGEHAENNAEYPCTIEEYVESASEVIEAGACGIHVDFGFVVDRDGNKLADQPLAEAYKQVINPLRDRHGWNFVTNCNVLTSDTFEECMSPITDGLAEVAPAAAGHPTAFLIPALTYAIEHGVSPEIALHDSGEIMLAKQRLIEGGIAKPPYNWIILYGMPFNRGRTLASGTYLSDTQDMIAHMLLMVNQLKKIDPASPVTICAAGRATLYMTTLATMLGLNIRVGLEDTPWRYPNADSTFGSNLEMFNAAKDLAARLGRRPATADEYRQMIGLAPKCAASS